ncbi:NUDIX hydrolase [Granulosicoccus sp. 3-233]|uniref:NUDIX hydrolase n=1 Tax=Granulosicoccus sp. 3-233 TaxID=3417969 RepID=UPI003D351B25
MTEWLDIVDDTDTVIGRAPRDRIHREGHLHRSAHIALFNSRGQLFVQLRSRFKDVAAGLWDTSAAGHVDSGESYEACAVRELHEELGVRIAVENLHSIGRLRPEERNGFEFTEVYAVRSDQALVLQAEEIEDGRWLGLQELEQWMQQKPADFTQVFRMICPMIKGLDRHF